MRRFANLLLVIALMFSVGGHWALVQTAAWTGMLVSYAKQGTVAEAIAKTFDGRHPCKFCKVVDAGTQDSKPQDTKVTDGVKKLELFSEVLLVSLSSPTVRRMVFVDESYRAISRVEAPDAPPPRVG